MAASPAQTIITCQQRKSEYGKSILTFGNCLLPSEKIATTPSVVDGMDPETEMDLRIVGCELIQTSCMLLRLPQVAMATGQVLFQRFYYSKSFVRYSMDMAAMACITLASKIEEESRMIRDVINVFHHVKQTRLGKTVDLLYLNKEYLNLKNDVIRAEATILKELGFCVHVKHPNKMIVSFLQVLNCKDQDLTQTAWNYMNDSLRTNVFVRYQPETIACACIFLSARLLKIPLPNEPPWFLLFNASEEDIRDICNAILCLYTRRKINLEIVEMTVDELWKEHQEAKLKSKGIPRKSILVTKLDEEFSPISKHRAPSRGNSTEGEDRHRDRKPFLSKCKKARENKDKSGSSKRYTNNSSLSGITAEPFEDKGRHLSRSRTCEENSNRRSHRKRRRSSSSNRLWHSHSKKSYKYTEKKRKRHASRSNSRTRHSDSHARSKKFSNENNEDILHHRIYSRKYGQW